MPDNPKEERLPQPGRLFAPGWIGVTLAAIVITVLLVWTRQARVQHEAEALTHESAQGQRVLVVHVQTASGQRTLEIPATVRGFIETPIYAKIAGYLKTIQVDKGDRVTAGQLLAVLDSPELDQQVANARANFKLQVLTDQRNQELVEKALIAQQVADESHSAMLQAKATLDELEATQAYKQIRAPFTGIVTARAVDPGALIPQSTTPAVAIPIVTLATLSPVRVYANVPQSAAPLIRNGDPATISVTEYPGRAFTGSVTRHPDALQPSTRTMLVEVDVANDDLALYPGMYAHASFTVASAASAPQVPDDALIFRGGKVYVPVVRDNRIALNEVHLGYDDGRLVEITSGISSDDLVAVNVGQAVRDGATVQPVSVDAP